LGTPLARNGAPKAGAGGWVSGSQGPAAWLLARLSRAVRLRTDGALLMWVLAMGFFHGMAYVFLLPPWQHHEEPSHFEYAWMILTHDEFPGYGAYDSAIRREIMASMIEHDFYRDFESVPDLATLEDPVHIGLGQANTAPFYHILMTVPLRLFQTSDVVVRLYAVRIASLGLYLLTVLFAFGLMRELAPPGHPLRWMVPAGVVLLPAVNDTMTAFNDDVGAIAVLSLFLWAAVRLVVRGPTLLRLLAVIGLAALAAWTKTTALIALPLAVAAIPLSFIRRWHLLLAVLPAIAIAAAVVAVLEWGDAASWYPSPVQPVPARVAPNGSAWGTHALRLQASPDNKRMELSQPLLRPDIITLQGQTVTLGAWIWSDTPGSAVLPMLWDGFNWNPRVVQVSTEPAFYAWQVQVPDDASRLWVRLVQNSAERNFYYDGVVLIAGERRDGTAPVFSDSQGRAGQWAGQPFHNYVRNASAETSAPRVRHWLEKSFQQLTGDYLSPGVTVGALYDWELTGQIHENTLRLTLQSFWGLFGWTHVSLPPIWYTITRWMTTLGLVGALVGVFYAGRRQPFRWKMTMAWLALALLTSWGSVVLRTVPSMLEYYQTLPVARYGFPVIIPTMLVLVAGWYTLLSRWQTLRILVPLGILLALDVVSAVTIYRYYAYLTGG
jgi:hypothetical protein